MKLLFSISLVVLLFSCSDLNKSEQLKRLDKMSNSLDASTVKLEENRMLESSELLVRSTELVEGIKRFEDDTIQLEIALKFERFKNMFDDLGPALEHHNELEEVLKAEKSVLLKLENDIKQGNGKRNKYDEYLSFEEKKVTELELAITSYVERWKKINTTYDDLHNEIDQLLVERFRLNEVR